MKLPLEHGASPDGKKLPESLFSNLHNIELSSISPDESVSSCWTHEADDFFVSLESSRTPAKLVGFIS